MSLTPREVIKRSMRMLGAVASGGDPDANEAADYLLALNTMKRAMFGTLIGPRLSVQTATGTTGQAENGGLYMIPAATFTLTLPSNPRSGARVGVADVNFSFGTYNCTVARNGRLLEGGAANLTLSTSGTNRQWWYRGDTGSWTREADYATLDDAIEFPDALIAYLPYMLSVVIAPEIAAQPTPEMAAGAVEGREAFFRTYGVRGANQIDPPIGLDAAQAPPGGSQ